MVKFCPLASGSSGNCVFAGTPNTRILIDAGVSGKKIQDAMKEIGEDAAKLDAIFVTHEHKDHIKAVGILSRRFDIPIYATEGTWQGMENDIGAISRKNKCIIYSGEKNIVNDMCIKSFDIPHDALQPVGFSIFAGETKVYNSTVNDVLARHCRACGISEISIHGLRHTHASLLLFAGVSIASVARRLGHASMTTTQKTYLHIIQELENKDVDLVMRTLSGL